MKDEQNTHTNSQGVQNRDREKWVYYAIANHFVRKIQFKCTAPLRTQPNQPNKPKIFIRNFCWNSKKELHRTLHCVLPSHSLTVEHLSFLSFFLHKFVICKWNRTHKNVKVLLEFVGATGNTWQLTLCSQSDFETKFLRHTIYPAIHKIFSKQKYQNFSWFWEIKICVCSSAQNSC